MLPSRLSCAAQLLRQKQSGEAITAHLNPKTQNAACYINSVSHEVRLLIKMAMDDGGYRRVEWKCDLLNSPSARAALRCSCHARCCLMLTHSIRFGFLFDGIFYENRVVRGRNRDTGARAELLAVRRFSHHHISRHLQLGSASRVPGGS
jgi:hypothetical protein